MLAELLGTDVPVVAAAESVRPYLLGALAEFSSRRIVVVTATTADAERLAHDLRAYVDESNVTVFPAWETLPFERVSPSSEVMGRRLAVLGDWLSDAAGPQVVVAPIKALLQRLASSASRNAPIEVEVGDLIDLSEVAARLVSAGYRRSTKSSTVGSSRFVAAFSTSFRRHSTPGSGSTVSVMRSIG